MQSPEQFKKAPLVQEMEKAQTDEDAQATRELVGMVVSRAAVIAYDPEVSEDIVISFQKGQRPAFVAANMANMLMRRVENQAIEDDLPDFPAEVIGLAGGVILEMVMNIAKQAGVAEFDEQEKEDAYYAAVDMYLAEEERRGNLDLAGTEQFTGIPVPEQIRHGISYKRDEVNQQPQGAPPSGPRRAGPPQGGMRPIGENTPVPQRGLLKQ